MQEAKKLTVQLEKKKKTLLYTCPFILLQVKNETG